MQFNPKETDLLKDIRDQEKLSVDKYNKYAADACNGALKNLFGTLSQRENQHLSSVNSLMGGNMPSQSGDVPLTKTPEGGCEYSDNASKQSDSYLCTDALTHEKFISSLYDTSIYEFRDTNVRDMLNHMQKEEQTHGEAIYNYMNAHGMY